MLVERDVGVPMRDGVVLRADVYRPDGDRPVAAIVTRTPYDKSRPMVPISALDPERAVEAGLALVCQDTRGRHASGGEFVPFVHERFDGYDTVEWAAAQGWCNGEVAMAGRSYGAATQWAAAIEQPPSLKAICPMLSGGERYDGWIYQGGAFQLGFNLFWAHLLVASRKATRPAEQYGHLPVRHLPLLQECPSASFFADWLDHATDDEFWRQWSLVGKYARVQVPASIVGGWFDLFLGNTLNSFVGARRESGSELTRQRHQLLIGPWGHGSIYGAYPDHRFEGFSSDESVDLTNMQLRFIREQLSPGAPTEIEAAPPVRLFVMGENRWRDEDDWPLRRTRYTRWFLHAGGGLSEVSPVEEAADSYTYDPADPVPTVGGPASLPALLFASSFGPSDQRRLEQRPDVLVYTSTPLQQAVEATGPLTVVLYAATTAPDTDFVAKLTDVTPSGESRILAEGILRASFRDGFERTVPVEPERVYAYTIDLVATSHVFLPGHRIRVDVTSSSFPRFDRNPNTGHPLGTDGPDDLRTARQTIFHDADRPSHIVLPIIPR
jgi:putative CocE/NonD family hydrolase